MSDETVLPSFISWKQALPWTGTGATQKKVGQVGAYAGALAIWNGHQVSFRNGRGQEEWRDDTCPSSRDPLAELAVTGSEHDAWHVNETKSLCMSIIQQSHW